MSEQSAETSAARFVRQFQEEDLAENPDYALLKHTKAHLQNRQLRKKYLVKQLQLLYAQLDKTRNYQEFVDTLMGSRQLLSEIFALEKHKERSSVVTPVIRNGARSSDLVAPSVNWSHYGIDVEEYLLASDASRDLVHQSGWVFHDM
ncbi:LAME_0H15764g1_1 [Lachancea meyersii CBS 8951]|uniref:LAME_0H15764g1_1 n=1 Tax=Lachancea meyersii CBS 8951 TaxID=1266667 RepID=A0A1G4KHR2_9SACH|nr:LAME_0H15764g1_1 [Lachancea meyersii CBS 8951]